MTTVKVTATPATILRHAVELADQRDGEDVFARQSRVLDGLGYELVSKGDGPLRAADLIRAAAAGRREFAVNASGSSAELLLHEAAALEQAAQIVDGDLGPLYDLIPTWQWTREMAAHVQASTSSNTTAADVAGLLTAVPPADLAAFGLATPPPPTAEAFNVGEGRSPGPLPLLTERPCQLQMCDHDEGECPTRDR